MVADRDNLHFLDYWRVVAARKEIVIAVALLVILAGIIVTYALPKVYMASTIVQVKEASPDVPIFTPEIYRFDPLFLRTQFEIIQSRPVIEEVIRRLNLNERLGRAFGYLDLLGEESFEQTVKVLKSRMKVQQYRDTNLIEIRIFMEEPRGAAPRLAADIANEFYQVFRDRNARRSREMTERAMRALFESLEEQRQRVTEAEQRVAAIQTRHGINIVNWQAGAAGALTKMSIAQFEQQRISYRMDLEDKRARHDTVMRLTADELLDAGPFLVNDMALARLVTDKRAAEVELSRLLESLGPRHPDVVNVRAGIDELDRKIDDALKGLRAGVLADYEAALARNRALEEMLDELKDIDRDSAGAGYHEFEMAQAELERRRRVLDALEMRYAQEGIEMRIPSTTVDQIEPAKAPSDLDPVRPKPLLNIVISVLVGFGAGISLAFFAEYLDTSVKTIDEVEKTMNVKVIGVIPQKVQPLSGPKAQAAHAEAYRVLRTNIRFAPSAKAGKVLCVTSGSVGEGKSLTVHNLACVAAQLGERILVVDADLHRPRQHKIAEVSNRPGLANVLMGEATLEEAVHRVDQGGFDLLPSGKIGAGVHGLLASERMPALIAQLKKRYDIVLVDSPPMIGVSDTSMLIRAVDAVLLVVQHRKYPRAVSMRAKDMIDNLGATLIGIVLNNINISRDYAYYYYHQHYYYYPREGRGEANENDPATERKGKA